MYSEITANKRKSWLIVAFFLALVAGVSWLVSVYFFESPSATGIVLIIAAIYALITYFAASRMAVAMHHAKQVDGKSAPRLYRIVENLSITNGMPMPKVYVIEDPALNAFATGRDHNHAIVAATTGLIDNLTDSELEGVMAHELGHVKNYDIRVSMLAFALVSVIAIIADVLMRSMLFGNRRGNDKAGGLILVAAIAGIILAPIIAKLMQLAISRKREYLADATGALTTRYPEGLASALEKISSQGASLQHQHTATAHLFFASPLKGKRLNSLFSTHPPIKDRIAKLRGMGDKL